MSAPRGLIPDSKDQKEVEDNLIDQFQLALKQRAKKISLTPVLLQQVTADKRNVAHIAAEFANKKQRLRCGDCWYSDAFLCVV